MEGFSAVYQEARNATTAAQKLEPLLQLLEDPQGAGPSPIEQLQEILGELNDLAVGGQLLAPAPAPSDGSAPQPEGLADALLARARRIYDDLAGTKPFWN